MKDYQQLLQNSRDILNKITKDKKLQGDQYPLALTPDDRKTVFAISSPIIITNRKRIYIIVYKRIIYNKFFSHKHPVYDSYDIDFRLWHLDIIQGFWMPVRNGLRIPMESFPPFLICSQELFKFFVEQAEKELNNNKK